MSQTTQTAIFTTVSGVLGGVGKAISAKPILLAITFSGLTNVVIYATASAVAGYLVKKIMDAGSRKLNELFSNKKSNNHE